MACGVLFNGRREINVKIYVHSDHMIYYLVLSILIF